MILAQRGRTKGFKYFLSNNGVVYENFKDLKLKWFESQFSVPQSKYKNNIDGKLKFDFSSNICTQ